MRDLIRERLGRGERPEAVKAYLVERYGLDAASMAKRGMAVEEIKRRIDATYGRRS